LHAALKELFDMRPENRKWPRAERSYRTGWVRKGYTDAAEARGLVVTDYKTGRPRAPERAQADQAFTMYALLVQTRFKQAPARLIWDFVETGDRVVTARAPEALDRARADVMQLVAQVRADEDYPASPGPLCGLCDYIERCPEGQAVREDGYPEPPAELIVAPGEE